MANDVQEGSIYIRLLGNTHFRSLWIGQIFSQLAVNTMLFVLALRVYQNTSSNAAVSGLFLSYGIPAVLFGVVAGTIVDRIDKRHILVVCDALRAVFVLVLLFFSHNISFVYLLTFLNALVTQFYVPAEAPTIPRIVAPEYLVAANSLFSFTYYSSLAVGTILAGPLLRSFAPGYVFFIISACFALAAVFNYSLPKNMDPTAKHLKSIFSKSAFTIVLRILTGLEEGIKYIRTAPVVLDSILLLTGTQVVLALLGTLGPGFADRMLRIDFRDASIVVVGPVVLGIITGSLLVGQTVNSATSSSFIKKGILAAGLILMIISLTVRFQQVDALRWIFTSHLILPIELVLFFALGVANSFLDVPANSLLQSSAQGSMRGRVYGLLTAAVGGVGILPIVVSGILADTIGVGRVIFLLGLVVCGYGIYRIKYKS